jgi:hypothetical protein
MAQSFNSRAISAEMGMLPISGYEKNGLTYDAPNPGFSWASA